MEAGWYVVHTKPRREAVAADNLQRQGYTVYLPRLQRRKYRRTRWVDIIEPLFPRYLFIRLTLNADNIAPLRSTRGVSALVRFGDAPAPVPEAFIASLKQTEDPQLGCHRHRETPLKAGAKATIVQGPFAGVTGIVERVSGDERVYLLLDMLGRQNRVALTMDTLVPAEA